MNYIFLALLSALFISITDVCNKSLINKGISSFKYTFWTRGIIYVICLLILLIFVVMNPQSNITNNDTNISDMIRLPKDKNVILLTILAGIASFISIIITYYSFKESNNISYTVAIISTTCIFTLLLSKLLFNTEINHIALLGICFIILGVYLISTIKNIN